jgi:thymidylate synthase
MLKNIVRASIGDKSEEFQYLHLIKDILNEGEIVDGRNGLTKTVFGASMYFSLKDGTIPILTTKKVAWKTCLRELFWFIKGSTSNKLLQEDNVKIWNGNASREFLDSRGLTHLEENDLGPVYGHQWRFFNAEYKDCNTDYTGQGIDQLKYIIDSLKNPETRYSRRLILSAWNPCQIDEMALPPCHVLMQFNVIGNKLSCSLYQRSGDVGLGVPFNIASYSFLTHIIAHYCGLDAHEFVYNLGNAHIYDDHLEALARQCELEPYKFPTLTISDREYSGIEDYCEKDIVLNNYKSNVPIKMEMRK